ncbi:SseB family protein [Microbacterium pumilum]|uniref:SseB protein N-terminal domain-containing protein n=1 Tax=Microbacterium pumilum TaxID=344165 RepID=A0ABN2SC53_9MICO
MALFSRRPKADRQQSVPAGVPDAADVAEPALTEQTPDAAIPAADETPEPAPEPQVAAEPAASVDISMSSFRGLGSHAPVEPAVEPSRTRAAGRSVAPPPTETIPGMRDNVLVHEALASLSDPPSPQELLDVARQLLQGHLFLRVKGDARELLAAGKDLPLAVVSLGDRNFVLAYSSGAALQASVRADGDVDTSAMAQPILTILRHVLGGPYHGIVLDQSSAPARASLPREILERIVDKADEALTVKTLLAEQRTAETAAAVAEALTRVPLWVAVGGPAGERPGIAEARAPDGSRYLEVYSHPLEVVVMGRSDQAAPLSAAQLAGALRSDEGLSGVLVDPRGPWIRLSRDELAPLLAS